MNRFKFYHNFKPLVKPGLAKSIPEIIQRHLAGEDVRIPQQKPRYIHEVTVTPGTTIPIEKDISLDNEPVPAHGDYMQRVFEAQESKDFNDNIEKAYETLQSIQKRVTPSEDNKPEE